MNMAAQRKEYAIVGAPGAGVARSRGWKHRIQGLDWVHPGAGNGHSRGWDSDKEALIERQWSLH